MGTFWTLERHQLPRGTLACELLADRGLGLFGDSSAGSRTRNRHGIGYVSDNTESITI